MLKKKGGGGRKIEKVCVFLGGGGEARERRKTETYTNTFQFNDLLIIIGLCLQTDDLNLVNFQFTVTLTFDGGFMLRS